MIMCRIRGASTAGALAAVVVLASGVGLVRAQAPKTYELGPDSLPKEGVPKGEVTTHVWSDSQAYPNTIRRYYLYSPPGHDPAEPAALMVFLDGHTYVSADGDYRAPTVLDNLIHEGAMPPTVGLFIDPGHRSDQLPPEPGWRPTPANRSVEYDTLGDKYATFLLTEMLPEVEKTHNITSDPDGRGICGMSSGGIAAFTVAWERPDQFRKVLSQIGSFTNIRGGHVYPALVRAERRNKPIRVFIQDGSHDLNNQFGNWYLANQQMVSSLEFKRYDVNHEFGEGEHNGNHAGSILPQSLRWLWRDYKLPAEDGSEEG